MADYYGTVAGFKTWADDRAATYTDDDGLITQALVRASEYIDLTFIALFEGLKTGGRDQVRQWPRIAVADREGYAVASNTAPLEIVNATYEGCVREMATPGSLNPDLKAGGGIIRRVKAGSVEVEYQTNSETRATFLRIEDALAPLIGRSSAYSGRAERA